MSKATKECCSASAEEGGGRSALRLMVSVEVSCSPKPYEPLNPPFVLGIQAGAS